jgi:hypothetical protein
VLEQYLTRPEEKADEEEVAEQGNFLRYTARTGRSHKIHMSICYQEQHCYIEHQI